MFLAGPFRVLGGVGQAPPRRFFNAGNAALGPKAPILASELICPQRQLGVAQDMTERVRSFCLAPESLLTLAYAWQIALRVVGLVGGHL